MHLIIDAQCLQTDTQQRGIGTYSLELIAAIIRNDSFRRVTLLLNRFAENGWTNSLGTWLENLEPKRTNLSFFESPNGRACQFLRGRKLAEESRESAISRLDPDALLILSQFQRRREVISGRTISTKNIPTAAILYDLIPFEFEGDFLFTRGIRKEYFEHLERMRAYDLLLSISASAKDSWNSIIGDSPPVAIIGAGRPTHLRDQDVSSQQPRTGTICLGAEGPHKNLPTLIKAYGALPGPILQEHPLTITGLRSPGYARYLKSVIPGDSHWLRLPGYLPRHEMQAELQSNRLLVVPSLREGLGLPVLEAASYGLPSLVSEGSSMAELIPRSEFHFDPRSTESMSGKLLEFLCDDEVASQALERQSQLLAEHTWDRVAVRTFEALASIQT